MATPTKRKRASVPQAVRSAARRKRRESVANTKRLEAVTDDRPVGKFIYLRPSVMRKVALASIDRDAALAVHRMSGEPVTEGMVTTRGFSGFIEQLLVRWFEEREAEARALLEKRRKAATTAATAATAAPETATTTTTRRQQ